MTPFRGVWLSLKSAQRALHFASERCSSCNRELLNVSRAEMPYSRSSERTSRASSSPKPARLWPRARSPHPAAPHFCGNGAPRPARRSQCSVYFHAHSVYLLCFPPYYTAPRTCATKRARCKMSKEKTPRIGVRKGFLSAVFALKLKV